MSGFLSMRCIRRVIISPPKTRAFLDFVTATVKSPNLDHGKGRQGIEPAR
jgi:hypothetical protein